MRYLTLAFCAVVTCLLVFTLLEAQELTDDLVLAFSFEGGAGNAIKDVSSQGNDGKIEGNPQWVEGKFGKALYFDGETYVVAPHIPFDGRSFTVQLWVKPDMTGDEVVFSQYELNAENLSLHFRIQSDSAIRLGFYSNDLDAPAGFVKKNEWRNLTFWFDGSDKTRKIYVDGQEVASGTSPSAYLGAVGETWIGGWERPTKPEHPFYQSYHGAIDEVRVWLRPLSGDEILSSLSIGMSIDPLEKVSSTWGGIKGIR